MEPPRTKHISDEDLERYSLGRLGESELAGVEEHILWCQGCQDRLDEFDQVADAMRGAGRRFRNDKSRPVLERWWRPALAVGFAAGLLIILALRMQSGRAAAAFAVVLQASRGPAGVGSEAPAGRPLALKLDLSELAAFPSYRVEVVDATGSRVWETSAAAHNGYAAVNLSTRLGKGHYFIRLYSPAADLLREYGLEAN